jgi:membrane protease YdiL (CAAX protease family)
MNKKTRSAIQSIIILLTFLLAWYGRKISLNYIDLSFAYNWQATLYFYAWWFIPSTLVAGFLYGFSNILSSLGLEKGIVKGFLFAALAVVPMFLGSAVTGSFNPDFHIWEMLKSSLLPGFFEEYLFRGFLFGLLFRKLGWGFLPAGLAGAVFFGLGHIYQGNSPEQALGIFFLTALGALWFAWLYIEWDNNLWVPIFLHTFMNLSWAMFDVSENALGGVYDNIFRIITITATVFITIYHNRQKKPAITKQVLFRNLNAGKF